MTHQLNINITSNNSSSSYGAYKIAANILLEDSFGIYTGEIPQSDKAFDFVKKSDWYGYVKSIDSPLDYTEFGTLHINFDTKTITSQNDINPFALPVTWLASSVEKALKSEDGYITPDSIFNHIRAGRIYSLDADNNKNFYNKDPIQFLNEIKNSQNNFYFEIPSDWKFENQ